ncbi:MAG: 1-acyl-sn-glycerol-3-phosphate acyltransferase, partial [Gemmatimonadales bacterium]|nr:1-acyl-sn-glycerol-3-phosphate acyltransferase [Gemmatimonadales bacterium]
HGLKAIIPGYLRVPYRPGGVYDQAGRGWARGLIRAAGVKVKTVGLERAPTDRPVVYVSNHQSLFDILALAATVPGTMRFVAKKEFLKIPILGRAMKSAGQIFIDRQNLARAFGAYEEAAQAVREGLNAVVFAEGTRSRTGALQPFKKGPFVFAIASQVPVIPVYCAGTFKVLPKGSIWVHPGPVTLYFGDMIPTEGLTYEDRGALLERTRDVIMKFRVDAGEEER